MDSDTKITSPAPVHALSGSALNVNIPLLDERAQEAAQANDTPAPASPADAPAIDSHSEEHTATDQDDSTPKNSAETAEDASNNEVAEKRADDVQSVTKEGSEEGEYDPEEPAYESARPPPPPSVDLQALLRSFNAQAPSQPQPQSEFAQDATAAQPSAEQSIEPPWHREGTAPAVTSEFTAPPLPPTDQRQDDALYELFLVEERAILATTAPHEFEPGARMFLGNLSSESTTKREVFFLFHKYGKLGQIALKPNFGFVQFMTAENCRKAIAGEQGRLFKDRRLQLEVSNPPRTRGARAAAASSGGGFSQQGLYPHSRRDGRSRSPNARRHDSPPYGGGRRRERRRSRSSSPRRGRGDYERATYRRTPSPPYRPPQTGAPAGALLPRYGNDIPEVQLIVTDRADPNYTYWVESSMRTASIKTDIFFMSPKYVLADVVRQQVAEGVLAVVFLNTQLQARSHVQVQVFDRSMGSANVRFEEYASLEVPVAIQLLLRERTKAASYAPPPLPAVPSYPNAGQPGRLATSGVPAAPFVPPSYAQIPPAASNQPADLAAVISQMDPAALQQVIGALTAQQQQSHPQHQLPPVQQMHSAPYPTATQLEDILRSLRR